MLTWFRGSLAAKQVGGAYNLLVIMLKHGVHGSSDDLPGLVHLTTEAGLVHLTTEAGLVHLTTEAGLVHLTTEAGLIQVTTAAGLVQ